MAITSSSLLPRLARSMTASLGLGEGLAAAAHAAADVVPEALVFIWLVRGDRLVLRAAAGALQCEHSGLGLDFGLTEGLPGQVASARRPLVIAAPADVAHVQHPAFLHAEGVRWFIGIPLAGRFALEGVLGILSRRAEPPDAEAVDMLGALAAQTALTAESARVAADSERRRRAAQALAAVSQALTHTLDVREVAQLVADSVCALLGAHDVAVYRVAPDSGDLVSVAFAGTFAGRDEPLVLRHGVGVAGRAVRERRLVTHRDVLNDPGLAYGPGLRERLEHHGFHAILAAPLLVNGEAIGALGVAMRGGLVFDAEARLLLEAFADQAAVALNTARLFAAERAARAEAEAAEARFRGLVENIDAVVTELELETRRTLYVSRHCESLLGYTVEQWTTEPGFWLAHVHPHDRERVQALTSAELAAGRDFAHEYRMLAADGRAVWVRDRVKIVREPGQPLRLRCLKVDITERKRTEALLAGDKLILEMIAAGQTLPRILDALCRMVEAQGEGMLCTVLLVDGDVLRDGAAPSLSLAYVQAIDGLVIGPEAGSCGTAAHRRQTVIVEDIATDPLWREYRALALAHGLRACWSVPVLDTAGVPLATLAMYYRTPRRPAEGDRRLIERAAHLAGIAVQRTRAEQALRASEQRYRTLAINIPDVAWLVDRTGNTLFIGPNSGKVSGYSPEEVYRAGPTGWFGRVHPDDLAMVRASFEALFDRGGTFDVEYRLQHKDGRWLWVHDRSVATYDEHGTTYAYGLYSDITDRKHAEEIRALLLNQVITVQEEERRRIARELHDETAQSLASLLLGLSALQEVRTVKAARAQAKDLHQVTTRALAEVRQLAWGLRPSVLDDLGLAAALERYASDFGRARGITIDVQAAGLGDGRMPASVETALYRIMQEALSNVARHAAARRVRVQLRRQAATVAMVVEDDGHGFDPARPPAPPSAARGLGIHTMRERAAVLKGSLTIESAPARGTRVAVEIPLTPESA